MNLINRTFIPLDLIEGFSLPQKKISPKYLYDDRGSILFEEICKLPEYYPTRTERDILIRSTTHLSKLLEQDPVIFELGSGSSTKTRILLNMIEGFGTYIPIEISQEILIETANSLRKDYLQLTVLPICADFTKFDTYHFQVQKQLSLLDRSSFGNRIIFFPGSTIGNFDPEQALDLLSDMSRLLGEGGHLIIGVDLVKEVDILEAAYNDSLGITASFNKNLLSHLNKRYRTNFNSEKFEHRAFFNPKKSRIEMHLVSQFAQDIILGNQLIHFNAGESIHTESSYKYTQDSFNELLKKSAFKPIDAWTDPQEKFAVFHSISCSKYQN